MLQSQLRNAGEIVSSYLPNIAGALAILVLGWIAALVISGLVGRLVGRFHRGSGLATQLEEAVPGEGLSIDRVAARVSFYLLMVLVLVGFFQVLQLAAISQPLNAFLDEIGAFGPRILGAGFLALAAWVIALVARVLVGRGVSAARLEDRLHRGLGVQMGSTGSLAKTMSEVTYWIVILLFLPAVLGALAVEGLLEPASAVTSRVVGFIPNLVGATLILVVGWFVARLIRGGVTRLLAAAGVDRLGGIGEGEDPRRISEVVGLVVYVFVLIPVVVSGLGALQLDAVTRPATDMLSQVLGALPSVFAATLVLAIAFVVARLLGGLAASAVEGGGLDRAAESLGMPGLVPDQGRQKVVSSAVVAVVMLLASVEATEMIGFAALSDLLTDFAVFLGRVATGIVVLGIALWLGGVAERSIRSSAVGSAALLGRVARLSIIVLGTSMAVGQLGIADDVLRLAFGLVLGSVAVAFAIAFGLGARDEAARFVREWTARQAGSLSHEEET